MKLQMQAMDVLYAYTETKMVLTNLDTMRDMGSVEHWTRTLMAPG